MRRKVVVSNLSFRADEAEVAKFFELAGTVASVQLARSSTGESRGCAVVEFAAEDNADIAVDVFNGRQLLGRTLSVRAYRQAPEHHAGPLRPATAHGRRHVQDHARSGEGHPRAK